MTKAPKYVPEIFIRNTRGFIDTGGVPTKGFPGYSLSLHPLAVTICGVKSLFYQSSTFVDLLVKKTSRDGYQSIYNDCI